MPSYYLFEHTIIIKRELGVFADFRQAQNHKTKRLLSLELKWKLKNYYYPNIEMNNQRNSYEVDLHERRIIEANKSAYFGEANKSAYFDSAQEDSVRLASSELILYRNAIR